MLVLRTEVSQGDGTKTPPRPTPPSPLPWDSTVTSDLTLEYTRHLGSGTIKVLTPKGGPTWYPEMGPKSHRKTQKSGILRIFREFHKIPGILWNFEIFQKFQEFCNSGSLFGGMLRMLTKPMLFYRFLSSFSLKNHFFRKKLKFPKIPTILVKFQEFWAKVWKFGGNQFSAKVDFEWKWANTYKKALVS